MAITPEILEELADIGLTGEQYGLVMRLLAKVQRADDARRAANAERQARLRDRQRDKRRDCHSDNNVTVTVTAEQKKAPHTPKENNNPLDEDKSSSSSPKAKRRSAMNETWQPSLKTLNDLIAEGFDAQWLQREIVRFRDYWIGRGDLRADWDATLRTWVRKDRENGRNGQRTDQPGKLTPEQIEAYERILRA